MSLENTTIVEILDTFEFLEDWEDKYRYIIDLGRQLPPLAEHEMSDEYKVRGCQSQVWLIPEVSDDGRIYLRGDSDAHIVKGLVAMMLLIFSGKTAEEIKATDARAILDQLGLASHLSPGRANGLFAMVERIYAIADAN
ncbi:SufE family protein [Kordiimonas aestuarii]|uniref:SufE family protein n=1 Tax=Kordiimonas aestuarii TaxID=1005925 RepID=UPI00374D46F6